MYSWTTYLKTIPNEQSLGFYSLGLKKIWLLLGVTLLVTSRSVGGSNEIINFKALCWRISNFPGIVNSWISFLGCKLCQALRANLSPSRHLSRAYKRLAKPSELTRLNILYDIWMWVWSLVSLFQPTSLKLLKRIKVAYLLFNEIDTYILLF